MASTPRAPSPRRTFAILPLPPIRSLCRPLALLILWALCLSPAWASFPGMPVYDYQRPDGQWDSTEEPDRQWAQEDFGYSNLDTLCFAASAHRPIWDMGWEVTDIDRANFRCVLTRATSNPPATIYVAFRQFRTFCPANSTLAQGSCTCNAGYTESGNACIVGTPPPPPIVVGFFNGVWNTRRDARDGLLALETLIGSERNGKPLVYQTFYNQTGSEDGNTFMEDIAETFIQRGKELDGVLANRWEHFWDVLAGRQQDPESLTGGLLSRLGSAAQALARLIDATFNDFMGKMGSWVSRFFSSPPTGADQAAHQAKINAFADEGNSFVLIAHSQGNLFVNPAYDQLRQSHPGTQAQVVQIAPASPTLRGDHLLADIDLVINGLRIQGLGSVPPININLPFSKKDASGHTLIGTYLDPDRASRERVNTMVQSALGAINAQ